MRISDWSSDVCSSDLLDGTAPAAQPAGENDVAASTLAVFREARELRRTHGAGAIGLYIISMARTAADALAVLALARIAGCVEGDAVPLDVAPLFETVADLEAAPSVMRALFDDPVYQIGRAHV